MNEFFLLLGKKSIERTVFFCLFIKPEEMSQEIMSVKLNCPCHVKKSREEEDEKKERTKKKGKAKRLHVCECYFRTTFSNSL